jgi:hypothetical protein
VRRGDVIVEFPMPKGRHASVVLVDFSISRLSQRLARAEDVGPNICVSVCCLMWGRTFVDSWLVLSAPLEVRRKVFNCFGRQLVRGPGVRAFCI